MLLALQVGADGRGDLANVDLGRCALGFSQQHPGVYIKLYVDPGVLVKVRHNCPLESSISRVPLGNPRNQQAADATEEAAVCSHRSLGPRRQRAWLVADRA